LELPPTDEVESHLAAIRSLRSVLDKLDLWDALTLPLCTRVHRSEETRLVPAPMGRHEGTDDGMPERHVVPRSSFSVTAHVCGRAACEDVRDVHSVAASRHWLVQLQLRWTHGPTLSSAGTQTGDARSIERITVMVPIPCSAPARSTEKVGHETRVPLSAR